jgi:single stranded DNA-binding protein
MSDMNTVVLSGRFVADPEVVATAKANVVKFRIATSRYDGKDKKEVADFWNVVRISSNSAEDHVSKFVISQGAKGKSIVLRGNLVQNTWTDKDGKDHRDAQINLSEVSNIFVPEKNVVQPQPVAQPQSQPVQTQPQEQYVPVQTAQGIMYMPLSQVQRTQPQAPQPQAPAQATHPQAQPVQAQPVQVTPPAGESDFFSADPNIVNGYC